MGERLTRERTRAADIRAAFRLVVGDGEDVGMRARGVLEECALRLAEPARDLDLSGAGDDALVAED